MSITVGQKIDDFEIVETHIGEGGWGVVHKAKNIDEKLIALKFLDKDLLTKQCRQEAEEFSKTLGTVEEKTKRLFSEKVKEFKSEYQRIKSFSHPYVAKAYKFGYHSEQFYIASEFVEGETLFKATRGMSPDEMTPLFLKTLQGLEAIHKHGLLHLDIKSPNVLVDEKGNLKIIDFGVSAATEALDIKVCGSIPYMPPEILFRKREFIGEGSDLYSFGCLMYYCLTRRHPFPRRDALDYFDIKGLKELMKAEKKIRPPSDYNIDVPMYLDMIMKRLVNNNYKDRFYGNNVRAVINSIATRRPDDFQESIEIKGSYLIPKNNEHIGRDKEKKPLFNALKEILTGKQPRPSIFVISGKSGMGKSHLLENVQDFISHYIDSIFFCHLRLPTPNEWLENWLKKVNLKTSDNKKPVIVTIDNVHEILTNHNDAPQKMKEYLSNLIELLTDRYKNPAIFTGNHPLLLLITIDKDGESKVLSELDLKNKFFHHIELLPFNKKEIEKYLTSTVALNHQKLPKKWIDNLYKATLGNPQELADRLQSIDSQGLLFGFDGKLQLANIDELPVGKAKTLPSSTKERITKLYKSLSDVEKDIIDLIAVWDHKHFTEPISYADIYRFYPQTYLVQIINSLIQKKILSHAAILSKYNFYDEYNMQTFVYNKLKEEVKDNLHIKIANHLSRNNLEEVSVLHKAYGTKSVEALRELVKLAREKLMKEGRILFAQEILEDCVKFIPDHFIKLRAYLHYLLVRTYAFGGYHQKAVEYYEGGLKLIDEVSNGMNVWRIRLTLAVLQTYLQPGHLKEAEEILTKLFDLFKTGKNNLLYLVSLNFKAKYLWYRSQEDLDNSGALLKEAMDLYKESKRLEEGFDKKSVFSNILNNELALVYYSLGRYEESEKEFGEFLDRVDKGDNIFTKLTAHYNTANTYRLTHKFEEAKKHANIVIKIAKQIGHGRWLFYVHNLLANIYSDMNHIQDAMREYDCCHGASLSLETASERTMAHSSVFVHKGHCYKEIGNYKDAILHFEAAFDRRVAGLLRVSALIGVGETYMLKKKYENYNTYLDMAEKTLTSIPKQFANPYKFRLEELRIRAHIQQGAINEARFLLPKLKPFIGNDPDLAEEYGKIERQINHAS